MAFRITPNPDVLDVASIDPSEFTVDYDADLINFAGVFNGVPGAESYAVQIQAGSTPGQTDVTVTLRGESHTITIEILSDENPVLKLAPGEVEGSENRFTPAGYIFKPNETRIFDVLEYSGTTHPLVVTPEDSGLFEEVTVDTENNVLIVTASDTIGSTSFEFAAGSTPFWNVTFEVMSEDDEDFPKVEDVTLSDYSLTLSRDELFAQSIDVSWLPDDLTPDQVNNELQITTNIKDVNGNTLVHVGPTGSSLDRLAKDENGDYIPKIIVKPSGLGGGFEDIENGFYPNGYTIEWSKGRDFKHTSIDITITD